MVTIVCGEEMNMIDIENLSDECLERLYFSLRRARKRGGLGIVGHATLQEVLNWRKHTAQEREEYRQRSNMANDAYERYAAFCRHHGSPKGKESEIQISVDEIARVISEYTPILTGEREDRRYNVFVVANERNFRHDVVPELIVTRLNTPLTRIEERVFFGNSSQGDRTTYKNFAHGGTVQGRYVPQFIHRMIHDNSTGVRYAYSHCDKG